ncbi:MAG: hypothetical protein LBS94_00390 [Prevotellaceae bacterium]|jgi:clan AA aspartic protease|nr:hypothetical protein [Prevotellaceae bacterium]
MSKVYETITLKNNDDLTLFALGHIAEKSIRQIDIKVLVDTGAHSALILPKEVCAQLGLRTTGTEDITVAGGAELQCSIVSSIELWWRKRNIVVSALVLPGEKEAILGITALEQLDLAVDPVNGILFGVHGEKKLLSVK